MAVNVKIKTGILLLVLMVQSPLYAITDRLAKILAGVAALATTACTGAILSNEDSSFLVPITVGLGSALVAYKYLYEETPAAKLKRANGMLNNLKTHGFVEMATRIERPNKERVDRFTEKDFLSEVNTHYHMERWSFIGAKNILDGLDPEIKSLRKLLDSAETDAKKDNLTTSYEEASNLCNTFSSNIIDAKVCIAKHPEYRKQSKLQMKDEALKIEKRNAAAREKTAEAQTEKAKAIKISSWRKFFKCFIRLFWSKNKSKKVTLYTN